MTYAAPFSPPHVAEPIVNLETEQALLGALLIKSSAYSAIPDLLPEHFGSALHGRVFEAIGTLLAAGGRPDPVTIKNVLGDDPVLVPLGGTAAFVSKLMMAAGPPSNAPYYAATLIEAAKKRAWQQVGHDLAAAAADPAINSTAIAAQVDAAVQQMTPHRSKHCLTRVSDLAGMPAPERQAIVPEWIFARQVALLSGDGGIGKSLIAMQLQIALASARPWLGLPVVPCRSVGFYAEDEDDELHRRLIDLAALMQVDIATLDRMAWRSTVDEDSELIEPDLAGNVHATAFFRQIEREAVGFAARLVVLDAATNFYGADEVKRRQVNSFLRLLRQLASKIDGAVLLLGHPSLAGMASGSGLSGSTHWNNGVRSRLYFTRPTDENANPDERIITKLKANYAGTGDVVRLMWQRGGFVALDEPGSIDRAAQSAKADRIFRQLLGATYAEGTWSSPNPTARNYAPILFAKRPDRDGLGKPAFEDAMHRLIQTGIVTIETYGKPSHQHHRLCMA